MPRPLLYSAHGRRHSNGPRRPPAIDSPAAQSAPLTQAAAPRSTSDFPRPAVKLRSDTGRHRLEFVRSRAGDAMSGLLPLSVSKKITRLVGARGNSSQPAPRPSLVGNGDESLPYQADRPGAGEARQCRPYRVRALRCGHPGGALRRGAADTGSGNPRSRSLHPFERACRAGPLRHAGASGLDSAERARLVLRRGHPPRRPSGDGIAGRRLLLRIARAGALHGLRCRPGRAHAGFGSSGVLPGERCRVQRGGCLGGCDVRRASQADEPHRDRGREPPASLRP